VALNSCSWQHLLVAPTRIFWREVLLTQAYCSSRDSRLSLLSAYCLCGWRCRQRLYATAGDSRARPAVHWLSQSTDFLFFCFFFTAILVPKKEKKRNCRCLFRPKNKTPKKMRFLAPKNKKKTKFGRPLLQSTCTNILHKTGST